MWKKVGKLKWKETVTGNIVQIKKELIPIENDKWQKGWSVYAIRKGGGKKIFVTKTKKTARRLASQWKRGLGRPFHFPK